MVGSAPTDATCCRTCALNAMKMAARRTKAPNVLSCPLGHLVGDSSFRKQPMHELKLDGTTDFEKCSQWLERLRNTEILKKLHKAQKTLDLHGPGSSHHQQLSSLNFRIAMTLRDCSILALIPKKSNNTASTVDWAMGDLDLKPDSRAKRNHWRGIEHELTVGGYYKLSREDQSVLGLRCYLTEYRELEERGLLG